jgi:hypothetical protein
MGGETVRRGVGETEWGRGEESMRRGIDETRKRGDGDEISELRTQNSERGTRRLWGRYKGVAMNAPDERRGFMEVLPVSRRLGVEPLAFVR